MKKCSNYGIKWWYFLIPPKEEFKKLCVSYDKSYMFLVVLSRTIFYWMIFNYLYNKEIVGYTYNNGVLEYDIKLYGLLILLLILLGNIILLISTIVRDQKNEKIDKVFTKEKKEFIPRKWYKSDLDKEVETCPSGLIERR
jgi:hypothetical protein